MGLPDGVMLPSTLGDGVSFTLNGGVLPTLEDPAFSPSCGLFARMFRNFWMIAMCFAFVLAAGWAVPLYCCDISVAALTVLSCSEIVGIVQ